MIQKFILPVIIVVNSSLVFCQDTGFKSVADATKNIKQIELSYFPEFNIKAEISLNQSDLIIALFCDSSWSHVITTNDFPMHCSDELKVHRENNIDSSLTIYFNCVTNHFIKDKGKYKIDTIWVNNESTIESAKIPGIKEIEATYFMSKYEIFSKDSSQHLVTDFYKIDELKNHCLHINKGFRNKSAEEWVNGKKHGKWTYWNKNGIETREVEYEHGKKIKETIF